MEQIIFYLWIGISLSILLGHIFYAGFRKTELDKHDDNIERENLIWQGIFATLLWPIGLGLAVIFFPFWLLFRLGKLLRNWGRA